MILAACKYRLSGLLYCGICEAKLIGKAGNGKNGKYFYYAHNRNFTTFDDRHLHRCILEWVPAPNIEEAVINRLCELEKDRTLLANIVRASQNTGKDVQDGIRVQISSMEQVRRKTEKTKDGLILSLADTPTEEARKSVFKKIEDLTQDVAQIEKEKERLHQELKNLEGNVIDFESARKVFKVFSAEFKTCEPHVQRELLKLAVQKLVIEEDGVRMYLYGSPREELIPVDSKFFSQFFRTVRCSPAVRFGGPGGN